MTGIHILSFGKLPDCKDSRRRNGNTRTEEDKIIYEKFLCDPKYSNKIKIKIKNKNKNIKQVVVDDKKIAPTSKSLIDKEDVINSILIKQIKSKIF